MADYSVGSQPGDDYAGIQAAMNAVASGNTLRIRNEVFAEGDLTAAGKSFTLRGHAANPAGTRWTLDASGFSDGIKVSLAGWDIRDGEIKNASADGITTTGALLRYSTRNCVVHDCGADGINQFDHAGLGIVDQCIVYSCGGAGIYSPGADDQRVYNSIVYDCVGYGICVGTSIGKPGKVYGCTVVGISGAPGHGIYNGNTSLSVRDCIVYNCVGDGINIQNGGVGGAVIGSVSNSNGSVNFNVATQTNCSAADPLLLAPGSLLFNVLPASPARGRGSVVTGLTYDNVGNPRPTPATGDYDAGALQYVNLDCGVSTWVQDDSLTVTCTFAPSGGGPQIPLQADAEDRANWTLTATPADATLAVIKAVRVSDYVYQVSTTHRMAVGSTVEVDTSAIATDAGGLCDDPGTADFVAVADPVDAALDTIGLDNCLLGPATPDGVPLYPGGTPPRRRT